jgi:hypothetical protein
MAGFEFHIFAQREVIGFAGCARNFGAAALY